MAFCLATHNGSKREELLRIAPRLGRLASTLAELGVSDVAPERGETFAENAAAKATHYRDRVGLPTLAEDSGLCIDALGGSPGVRSARYPGGRSQEVTHRDLLAQLGEGDHSARFVCALSLQIDPERAIEVQRECEGWIVSPRGDGGFGYDPIFRSQGEPRTFAELPDSEKDAVSHRGLAVRELVATLDRSAGLWELLGATTG